MAFQIVPLIGFAELTGLGLDHTHWRSLVSKVSDTIEPLWVKGNSIASQSIDYQYRKDNKGN